MALAQFGRRCRRFGKRLFSPLTLSLPTLLLRTWERSHSRWKAGQSGKNVRLYAFSWYQHQRSLSPLFPRIFFAYSSLLYPLHCLCESLWSVSLLCLLLGCLRLCLCLCAGVLTRDQSVYSLMRLCVHWLECVRAAGRVRLGEGQSGWASERGRREKER